MGTYDFLKRMLGRSQPRAPVAAPAKTAAPVKTPVPTQTRTPARKPILDRRSSGRIDARAGLRVLIIDDSATIVAVLGKMLRQSGYDTAGAGTAELGLEFARKEQPDLIFLDIVLPGMSGFDALRQLRRDPVTQDTPIIMISGNVQATEQFYVRRIGADDFMKKPFGRAEVFSRISKLVEQGRLPERSGLAGDAGDDDDTASMGGADMADDGMVVDDGGTRSRDELSLTR